MEQSTAGSPWLLLLFLAAWTAGYRVHQHAIAGFISIDCGLPGKANYEDATTTLSYVPDAGFTDDAAGTNMNISAEHMTSQLSRRYHDVRSFPDGVRNCYTLRSLVSGRKYLLRAAFLYGDYDGLGRPPVFDLHAGVNYWMTVNASDPGEEVIAEALVVVPDDFVQVCLVNTGTGTPFVSALELRPLKMRYYPQVNLTQGLVLAHRLNLGPETGIVRYPDDPNDRVWTAFALKEGREISMTETMQFNYEVPMVVMQTAVTPSNASENIDLSWEPILPTNALREFYVSINGVKMASYIRLPYLGVNMVYNQDAPYRESRYNISIGVTANSTLPPVLSAIELFFSMSTTNLATDSRDVIGYCNDGEHMALVYEFMQEGTLEEHISGRDHNGVCLRWKHRLRIAVESAQGLEYLHKGCNPPLIHRDVKASNILLNSRMEAKIADFGLSKAFNHGNETALSTDAVVGTLGYVDPEYQTIGRPTTKSDVYSFGIVLLVIVTGKLPTLNNPQNMSIIEGVQQQLSQGNIEGVVDVRMHGDHDINSTWKVAEIALKCTSKSSMHRPTMTDVVAQLQECLKLEEDRDDGDMNQGFYTSIDRNDLDWRYDAYPMHHSMNMNESRTMMEHNFGRVPTMDTGPTVR
ncbi:hypothetical protein ACQ4PT_021267 [Festuca glaucescens]